MGGLGVGLSKAVEQYEKEMFWITFEDEDVMQHCIVSESIP